ncbi:MAG: transcriptional regulator FilR1 domain-containing protein [Methanoregula sp.]
MEPLEVYNKNYKLIQSIYSSRLKIQILLAIAQGPKPLAVLREVTGSTSQAIIPKIRSLERLSLVEPWEHGYAITPSGRILVTKIEDFVMTMGELTQHREFWATHDIEGIPRPFLHTIGALFGSEVEFDTTDNMFHIYTHFITILQQAGYIHAISSVMSPTVADVLSERIIAGIPVELVVSRSIAAGLLQEPFLSKIQKLKPYQNFKIWIVEEPLSLGLTITDKHLSLGLNKKISNIYDSSADMFSTDIKAREWAEQLFQYYRNRAVLLESG